MSFADSQRYDSYIKYSNKFLRFIGFYSIYQVKVLGEPKCHKDHYTYNCQALTRTDYIFHFKRRTVKLT